MSAFRRISALMLGVFLAASAAAIHGQSEVKGAATLRDAVAMVERDTGGRILAAETVTTGDSRIYRIKVLTPDGTVRVVQVVGTDDVKRS
ncbi:MAG: hypothetical protein ABIP49_04395 [Lysobacterales bacterium]